MLYKFVEVNIKVWILMDILKPDFSVCLRLITLKFNSLLDKLRENK